MKFNFQRVKSLLSRFNNRYLIAAFVFLIWISFLDKNNMISQYELINELKGLRKEHNFYKSEITKDSILIQKLKSDPEFLEKFAREKYLMKRDDEDIFLMVDTSAIKLKH